MGGRIGLENALIHSKIVSDRKEFVFSQGDVPGVYPSHQSHGSSTGSWLSSTGNEQGPR